MNRAIAASELSELRPAHLHSDRPSYVAVNKAAWERWAPAHVDRGRQAWSQLEPTWGLWDTPEIQLRLLERVAPAVDVIELGSGTAAISAWLAARGMRPIAVDFSKAQVATAENLAREFGVAFPIICANGAEVPFDEESFDVAISEYGVSLWSDPRDWLLEAARLLRPNGVLVFFTTAAVLNICTSLRDGEVGLDLVREYFAGYRLEYGDGEGIEFHPTHGHWIRLLRAHGFVIEDLIEVRPPRDARPRFDFVAVEWARRWPSEEIWIARKTGDPGTLIDRLEAETLSSRHEPQRLPQHPEVVADESQPAPRSARLHIGEV